MFATPPNQTIASLPVTAPPSDGTTISGTYSFIVDASPLPNIATVEFNIGSLRIGVAQTAPYQVNWNTGYGKDGTYSVQVIARDATGHTIGTGQRLFNIANHGVTLNLSSPDISQQLSGIVALRALAHDPVNYPAIFNLFIDGELRGYWDPGSSPPAHSTTATFNINTTAFSNGQHELTIGITAWKEPVLPHTYAGYSAMLDRAITVNNGHALMEIAPNYQHIYLQPGQTLALSCRQFFTDNTFAPCNAPVYSTDNSAIASASGNLIEAISAGFTTVTVSDSGKTATAYVWVKSNLNIPHLSGAGQILNSYQDGNSVFPVAPYVLEPAFMESGIFDETKRAGFNTLTFGFYLNPRSTTISYADWKSAQDAIITSRISWAIANGFHIIGTGDDGFRRPGDDAWWTLNWTYGQQATQYATQTLLNSGVAIAINVVDEASSFWGWYPVNPSKVGQSGLPGQPASFQSVSCNGTTCTVNWPHHSYGSGQWIGFKGSQHPELNTVPGQPFVIQGTTQNTFNFVPNAPITGSFTSATDPSLEIMLFAPWPCNNRPCAPFTANDAVSTYSSWLRNGPSHVPFSWPSLGLLPPAAQGNWAGQSAVAQGISDFAMHYWTILSSMRTYSWAGGVQQGVYWMRNAFYSRQNYMAQDRPQLMEVCGSSFAYLKQNAASAYYDPVLDKLDQPGCDGAGAAAEIMTAAALGNAGVRQYQFDMYTPSQRAAYPVGSYLETGIRPDSGDQNSKSIWQASGYATNLITKILQPYILGVALSSPAYVRGITTAVRRGSNATMLMVVNGNDAERSVSIDFTPYRTGAPITRYQLSYVSLRSDLLPDAPNDNIVLPKGGSAVYLFPLSPGTTFLHPTSFEPQLPVGASQAVLSYNYIYNDHLAQATDGIDCTAGCALQLDTRLGDIYYQFTYTDTNGNVTGRSSVLKAKTGAAVNLVASSLNQVYDGTPKTVSVTTDPPGLSTSVAYSQNGKTISTPTGVGNYSFIVAVTDPNYQGFATGTLIVSKGVPAITWPNPPAITYGTPLDTTQLNAKATFNGSSIAGTFTYSSALGTVLGAGSQMLSATFIPADTTDLINVTGTITLQVNKATPTVTWSNPVAINYGMSLSATQLNASAAVSGAFSYNPSIGTLLTAGLQNLSATFVPADSADYNTVTGAVQINVLPAPLKVTANSASRFYGSANPPLTGIVSGLVRTENITVTFTTNATPDSQPGKYPITAVLHDPSHRLPNYVLTEADGILTVIPAPIITLSSTAADFGMQDLYSVSKSVTLVVKNIGTADLTIAASSLTGVHAGDFTLGNNCSSAIAPGATCSMSLAFTPTGLRSRTAILTLTDNTDGHAGNHQTVALTGNGVLTYAVYATGDQCGAIALSNNAFTDSFESDRGNYLKTKSNVGGDIAVNGNATMSTNATVNGMIFAPHPVVGGCKDGTPGISISGQAHATAGYAALTPLGFIAPPLMIAGTSDMKVTSSKILHAGKYGDVTVSNKATLTLSPGTYVFNSLKLMDGANITISPAGQVILNIEGLHADKPVDLTGGNLNILSGHPADLLIIYGGSGELDLTGKTDSYGIVYAPKADAKMSGQADWFGALVVKTLHDSGGGAIHFDSALLQ